MRTVNRTMTENLSQWCAFALLLLAASAPQIAAAADNIDYRVIAQYPHDTSAYTQGLVYHRGFLYESTGLHGRSAVMQVAIATGKTVRKQKLPRRYFGEGLARYGDRLIQLTWREGTGFIYRLEDFVKIGEFSYPGEGWGLAAGDSRLVMSDGSSELRFLDPHTLTEQSRLEVFDDGRPVPELNELEWIDGQVYANILGQDRIARIDPETGEVTGWLDLSDLRRKGREWRQAADLNGIAWDSYTGRLFVTGKRWPRLYVISLQHASYRH